MMLTEQRVREIAQEVFNKGGNSAQYSTTKVPRHIHNGNDSPLLNPANFIGFSQLGSGQADVLGTLNNNAVMSNQGNTTVFGIPIVAFGVSGGFNGGNAPDGTMILGASGLALTTNLWIRYDGTWYGFAASSTM